MLRTYFRGTRSRQLFYFSSSAQSRIESILKEKFSPTKLKVTDTSGGTQRSIQMTEHNLK